MVSMSGQWDDSFATWRTQKQMKRDVMSNVYEMLSEVWIWWKRAHGSFNWFSSIWSSVKEIIFIENWGNEFPVNSVKNCRQLWLNWASCGGTQVLMIMEHLQLFLWWMLNREIRRAQEHTGLTTRNLAMTTSTDGLTLEPQKKMFNSSTKSFFH